MNSYPNPLVNKSSRANQRQQVRQMSTLVACLVLLMSCQKKQVEPLPAESQSGQDVIACRIDGAVWLPHFTFRWDFMSPGTGRIARYSKKNKTLFVGGANDENGRAVGFSLINCRGEGTYVLTNQCSDVVRPTTNCGFYAPGIYISSNTYWTDAQHEGQVVITKLTDEIVAGRFSFSAINQQSGKSVRITEGRFDFYYARGVDD